MFKRAFRLFSSQNVKQLFKISVTGLTLISSERVISSQFNNSNIHMKVNQEPTVPQYNQYDIDNDNDKYCIYLVDFHKYPKEVQLQISEQIEFLRESAHGMICNKRKQIKVSVMILDSENAFQKSSFENKYGISVKSDSLIFMKNRKEGCSLLDYNIRMFQRQQLQTAIKYFNKPIKVNKDNIDKFLGNNFDSEITIICLKNKKGNQDYKNIKQQFDTYYYHPHYNNNVVFLILSDSTSIERMGMAQQPEGQLQIMKLIGKKTNDNDVIYQSGEKRWSRQQVGNIKDIPEMEEFIRSNSNSFSKISNFTDGKFRRDGVSTDVILEIDMNKIKKHEYRYLLQQCKKIELQKNQQMIIKKSDLEDKPYRILIKDHLAFHTSYDKPSNTYQSTHEYQYEGSISTLSLQTFINNFHKQEMFYKSSAAPEKHYYTRKVVGESFKQLIQESVSDQGMMFYSKGCHGCKMAGKQLEVIARESIENKTDMTFNRMDSDLNKLEEYTNYAYTPVIMMFKADYKQKAYLYRSNTIMKGQLKDFFYVTKAFDLMPQQTFDSHLKSHQDSQQMVNQMVNQVIG